MNRRIVHSADKPPLGYGLNPAHPLAPFVVDAWFFQEGGGSPTSLLRATAIPPIGTTSWDGRGFTTNATGAGSSLTTPAYLKILPPFSFAWQGRVLSASPNTSNIFSITYNNSNGSPFNANVIYGTSSKFNYGTNLNGTNFFSVQDASTLPFTGRQQVVGTTGYATGNFLRIYRNGVQGGINNVGISGTGYSATSQIGFGSTTGNASGNPAVIHDFGILFSRELQPAEVQILWTDPYDLLTPIRPRSRGTGSVAVILANPAALLPAM